MTRRIEMLVKEYNNAKKDFNVATQKNDKLGVEMWSNSMLFWLDKIQQFMKIDGVPFDTIKNAMI